MAKHMVKCSICGERFDANSYPYVMTSARRYAHETCYNQKQEKMSQEDKDKLILEDYIKQLLQTDYIDPRVRKQLKSYIEEYKYTYSGIYKALIYFYEIKGNSIEKANGGIGIVPYVYTQAYRYYYSLWQAQQINNDKVIEAYQPIIKEIRILSPERKRKKRNLFAFLDKEGNNE